MINTYRTSDDADRDKAHLVELFEALHASPSVLRRNDDGLWIIRGRPGCYVSTWGDGKSWHLVVAPEDEVSPLQWTWFKKRLPFCEVTQDGRLPTAAEAEVIRDIIGIRKRMDLSAEAQAERTARLPRRGTG